MIRTAALINGSRALHLLTSFAQDPRIEVQRELIDVWRYFEPEQYAQQVLQDASLDGGRVWLTEPALLPSSARLRHLTQMRLDTESSVDLDSLHASPQLTRLSLMRGWRGSTQALDRFPNLRALLLSADRPITNADISPLSELTGLRRLWLYGDGIRQDAIEALTLATQLTHFHVTTAEDVDLSAVARMPVLRMLGITGQGAGTLRGLPPTGLSGLSLGHLDHAPDGPVALAEAFPMLTELQLYGSGWPEDLSFLHRFTQLQQLSLDHSMTGRIASLRSPTALQEINLGFAAEVDLSPLARLPHLRRISLRWIERPVSLAAFSTWDGDKLTIEATRAQRLTHRDQLPSSVRIRRVQSDNVRYD